MGTLEIKDYEDSRNKSKAWKIKSSQWKAIDWKGDSKMTRKSWEVAEWVISFVPPHVGMC